MLHLMFVVSCAGCERIHTGQEDLAGRRWCYLCWRHEQPLRFLCGRVPVSDTSSWHEGTATCTGSVHSAPLCAPALGSGLAPYCLATLFPFCSHTPLHAFTPCIPLWAIEAFQSTGSRSGNHILSFFEATAIAGSWGWSSGTAQ